MKEKLRYNNGKKDGEQLSYYEDGQLKERWNYKYNVKTIEESYPNSEIYENYGYEVTEEDINKWYSFLDYEKELYGIEISENEPDDLPF